MKINWKLLFFTWFLNFQIDAHEFVLLIASYNNAQWYKKNLDSVISQNYNNFEVIYIDDISTDGTFELVQEYIGQHAAVLKEKNIKFTLVKNSEKYYCLGNYYREIHKLPDHKIIVTLDGDDWLAHENVLSYLSSVYDNPGVWLTYGQNQVWPENTVPFKARPYPEDVIKKNKFRDVEWRIMHLRSFYAGLFKKIKKEDLMYQNELIVYAEDVAYMIPMCEMAGSHVKFIDKVLYIYNKANTLSQIPVFGNEKITEIVVHILHRKNNDKYSPIASPF